MEWFNEGPGVNCAGSRFHCRFCMVWCVHFVVGCELLSSPICLRDCPLARQNGVRHGIKGQKINARKITKLSFLQKVNFVKWSRYHYDGYGYCRHGMAVCRCFLLIVTMYCCIFIESEIASLCIGVVFSPCLKLPHILFNIFLPLSHGLFKTLLVHKQTCMESIVFVWIACIPVFLYPIFNC